MPTPHPTPTATAEHMRPVLLPCGCVTWWRRSSTSPDGVVEQRRPGTRAQYPGCAQGSTEHRRMLVEHARALEVGDPDAWALDQLGQVA